MGAKLSFLAPKVMNFDHFAILEPEIELSAFWEQNLGDYIFQVPLTTKRARIVL
jgi:hypothetical protein